MTYYPAYNSTEGTKYHMIPFENGNLVFVVFFIKQKLLTGHSALFYLAVFHGVSSNQTTKKDHFHDK